MSGLRSARFLLRSTGFYNLVNVSGVAFAPIPPNGSGRGALLLIFGAICSYSIMKSKPVRNEAGAGESTAQNSTTTPAFCSTLTYLEPDDRGNGRCFG